MRAWRRSRIVPYVDIRLDCLDTNPSEYLLAHTYRVILQALKAEDHKTLDMEYFENFVEIVDIKTSV
jgi:hypothetical protein